MMVSKLKARVTSDVLVREKGRYQANDLQKMRRKGLNLRLET